MSIERIFPGTAATTRSALGVVRIIHENPPSHSHAETGDPRTELLRFDASLARSREQLEGMREEATSSEAHDILDGQLLILADPELVRGVIQVINRTNGTFSETDLAPLEDLCKLIGYTIYNARLYEEINSLKQLKKREAEYMRILVHELRSPIASATPVPAAGRLAARASGTVVSCSFPSVPSMCDSTSMSLSSSAGILRV